MYRKIFVFLLSAILVLGLTACGGKEPTETHSSGPGRMVRRIEVSIQPEDPDLARVYTTQENMNALLSLLRGMQTSAEPETEPDLENGQSYYTVTVTYANGQQSIYYLLGHTYLRLGDEPWCVIDQEDSKVFVTYLREHPSDEA
jgi:hypothetical protein